MLKDSVYNIQQPPTENELKWARIYGVRMIEPGFIYIVQDQGRFKIGRSKRPRSRIRAALTWLPDGSVVGTKPFWNHKMIEENLHTGFAASWYHKEWFAPIDDEYRNILVDGFREFSDDNRFRNSIDFIYWFSSSGMAEFVIERTQQEKTLRKFLVTEAAAPKNDR